MLKSYPRLYATIVLAAMILAGCSTPAKNIVRVDYAEQAKNIRTIGILAPDVDYYDVSLGGVREKNDEETDVVRANVTEALKAELTTRGFTVKVIPREGGQKQDLDEILGLFTSIAGSYHGHADTRIKANRFPHKAASFDYSVGPLDSVLDPNKVDALLLAKGLCEGNSLLHPGRTVIIVTLADRTGALLWYHRYIQQSSRAGRNIRHPENAERIIKSMFDTIPEVPK